MAKKFKSQINKEGTGVFTDVYIEADNSIDAERLLKAQYAGYKIIYVREITSSEDSKTSSNSSSTGCALVLLPFVGLIAYGLWHII